MNLQEENEELRKQLNAAKLWMSREVQSSQKNIIIQDSEGDQNSLYHENLEDMIEQKIYSFFPSQVLTQFPSNGVKNMVSSELIYYHIIQGGHVDGTGVMIGYQKILDSMIELYITKGFRKYVLKHKLSHIPKNDPLEKSFHQVIEKKYILSVGRLYGILKNIHNHATLFGYQKYFFEYLKSRTFLQKALLETDFLLQLQRLTDLHALGEKRHSGTLSAEDTKTARNILIGNFQNQNCLLYILAESQSVDL